MPAKCNIVFERSTRGWTAVRFKKSRVVGELNFFGPLIEKRGRKGKVTKRMREVARKHLCSDLFERRR